MSTANGTADAVAMLRSRGLALCKPSAGGKNPATPGWPTRSLESSDFKPGDPIGIIAGPLSDSGRPGHALVIIDADALEAVEKADEFLPVTGMCEGREGKPRDHRYYLVPLATIPDWARSKAAQAAPAAERHAGHPGPWKKGFNHGCTKKRILDFLGTGGQAVCPYPGGRRFWEGGTPGEPAVVPFMELWDAVCRLAMACGCSAVKTSDGWRLRAEAPLRAEERARLYARKSPGAISGQGGHDQTFSVARAVVWGFDLGVERGLAVMLEEFNPKCTPPWTEPEMRHKCEEADTVPFDKPRGYLLGEERNGTHHGNGRAHRQDDSPGMPPPEAPQSNAPSGDQVEEDRHHLTDLGNARRVIKRHGEDLRYCHPAKEWFAWDGRRWAADVTGEAVRRVKDTQRALFRWIGQKIQALGEPGDDEERNKQLAALRAMLKHALKWEGAHDISRCLELARSEPGVPILHDEMDRNPLLLNVLNGTIDLKAGVLLPHNRADLITKLAPVTFDGSAACPLWERSLLRWMDGKTHLAGYLQRVVGYGLTGDVSEQCLWFFHGGGANGKSTFLMAVLAMLGDYAMQAVSELLMVKHHESHPTERADLFGKRFVATIETEEGKRVAEALMKQLTGGDKVRARKMRQDFFEFDPTHKIFLAANHKPAVKGTDHAVWRRIKLVPWTVTIPDREKDKALPDKLKAELPGILNWAIQGCLDWQQNGMQEPDEVRQATAQYQREQDIIERFLCECCVRQPWAKIKVSTLYEAYGTWSGDKYTTQPEFNDRMRAKGYASERETKGYMWQGVGLYVPGMNQCEPNSDTF
jgi:P4 family phage/plasmid primase-like protien